MKRILQVGIIVLIAIGGLGSLLFKDILNFGDVAMAEDFSKPTKKDKSFKTMEKEVKGEKHILKYYMYEEPEAIKLIPLEQTRRDTAKDTLISIFSHFEYSNDQDKYMDHFLESKSTTDLIKKIGWDELMRRSREIEKRISRREIIGEARYKNYIVYIVKDIPKQNDGSAGGITGYFFKKIGNKYYSDDDPGREDLFLQALDGYEWDMEKIKDLKEEDM